jgi:hypothetical protein
MITNNDRTILRDLAQRVAEVAALPVQAERRKLWKKHNALQPVRPLILVFPEGSWNELLPDATLRCTDDTAQKTERQLRSRLYYHEHFQDDTVMERTWIVGKTIHKSGWGLEPKQSARATERGSWHFEPVILDPADLKKLRYPEITYDEMATQTAWREAQELFGDILDVKLKGVSHISFHLMALYTGWRGLEEMMMDMVDNPGLLHEAMAFLTEGYRRMLQQYVDQNLLSLNNDGTYHNSGGVGYTDELPATGFNSDRVRLGDMWGSTEVQELTAVSPDQHEEFAMQYERHLLAPFGLTGYGCCEDLTRKLDRVCALPHMRRISIAPFANVDLCAPQLQNKFIFSWKPQPSHLVGNFDEPMIRQYIRHTVEVARQHGCVLEMILKDTHTCEHHPERFDRWTQIAREEITR